MGVVCTNYLFNLKLDVNFCMLFFCVRVPLVGKLSSSRAAVLLQSHCGNQGGVDINLRVSGLLVIAFKIVQ